MMAFNNQWVPRGTTAQLLKVHDIFHDNLLWGRSEDDVVIETVASISEFPLTTSTIHPGSIEMTSRATWIIELFMYHLSIGIWKCCKAGGVINIGWCSDTGKWDGGRHVSYVWSVQNGYYKTMLKRCLLLSVYSLWHFHFYTLFAYLDASPLTHCDRQMRCKRKDQSVAAVVCLMIPPANGRREFTLKLRKGSFSSLGRVCDAWLTV